MRILTRYLAQTSAVVLGLSWSLVAVAQDAAPAPDTAPATKPSTPDLARQPITAKVIEVHGDVKYGAVGSTELKKAQTGDELPENTKIRTGVRSSIKLQLGSEEPYTALLIDSVGVVVLSELAKNADSKKSRVFVEQGRVRAGVAEGALTSDFTIDCPVATLSKKGTWGIYFFYARGSDSFEAGLLNRGLIEVINEVTRERRQISPGQVVTQAMRMWLDESAIRRNVAVADLFGQGDLTLSYNRSAGEGIGVTGIGDGQAVSKNLGTSRNQNGTTESDQRQTTSTVAAQIPSATPNGPVLRPEGFFGTGRGDDLVRFLSGVKSAAKR